MDIKKILREKLTEDKSPKSSPIDLNKLKEYAKAIGIICNGEYGTVYYNESESSILINLGDANPFDDYLKEFMLGAISKNYDREREISIEIENEIGHPGENWVEVI